MHFSFTPRAARRLGRILADKGGDLALKIEISTSLTGKQQWSILLEPRTDGTFDVDGIPVTCDDRTFEYLQHLRIDWVTTPDGEGLGVFHTSLYSEPQRRSG